MRVLGKCRQILRAASRLEVSSVQTNFKTTTQILSIDISKLPGFNLEIWVVLMDFSRKVHYSAGGGFFFFFGGGAFLEGFEISEHLGCARKTSLRTAKVCGPKQLLPV